MVEDPCGDLPGLPTVPTWPARLERGQRVTLPELFWYFWGWGPAEFQAWTRQPDSARAAARHPLNILAPMRDTEDGRDAEAIGLELRHADAECVGGYVTFLVRHPQQLWRSVSIARNRFVLGDLPGDRIRAILCLR